MRAEKRITLDDVRPCARTHAAGSTHYHLTRSAWDALAEPSTGHVHRGAWCDVCVVYGADAVAGVLDPQRLARAIEIAENTPLLGIGMTRVEVVIREYVGHEHSIIRTEQVVGRLPNGEDLVEERFDCPCGRDMTREALGVAR